MAYLSQVRVKDFRAFRDASFDLPPNGVVLIAGPNNAGKSALLSALDVIAGKETPIAARHAKGERAQVFARFRLTEQESIHLLGDTENAPALAQKGAAEWVEWEFSEAEGRMVALVIRVAWPDENDLIVAQMTQTTGMWSASVPGQPLASWSRTAFTSPHGASSQLYPGSLHGLGILGEVGSARNVLLDWHQGYFHFEPLRLGSKRSTDINATPNLESNGANLANALASISTNFLKEWAQLNGLIEQFVPGVGRLMSPISGNQVQITFADEPSGYQMNLKDVGSGVEQLLMTFVVGLTQTATTVVLEEPETALNPAAQRALLGVLQEWSEDRLFIASTHSAAMLDWSSPRVHIYSVTRSAFESQVSPVKTDRAAVLRELGVRLSDVLSADRILIIEGPTEKDILTTWFPEVVRNPRLAMVLGEGGYNARHADLLADWIEKTDVLGPRRILYVRDRDELSSVHLQKLEASPNVHVLPCRELENLFLNANALATVINTELECKSKSGVTVEALEAEMKTSVDSLKQTVVLKRAMAELADPLRYVDHPLRRELAKQKAGKSALTEAVLARTESPETIQQRINDAWERHTHAVEESWDSDWLNLAPGADLLNLLWKRYLDRGYNKLKDGLAIAQAMQEPPEALQAVMAKFMAE